MAEMNWIYLAGFFDGEGCVHISTSKKGRARMPFSLSMTQTQKNQGQELFEEIRRFVASEGIKPRIFLRKKYANASDAYTFIVYRVADVVLFLNKCLPWLRVKRTIAQDALRYRKMFPSPRAICTHMGLHDSGRCRECIKIRKRNWARKDRRNNPLRYQRINERRRLKM